MENEKRYAVIDIGSNSIRYMTADAGGRKLTVTTRLGSGLAETGLLNEDRMAHSIRVIAAMAANARHAGYTPIAYATSAVRDSRNREEFLSRVYDASGVTPDVLSGEREAEYAYAAATSGHGGLIDVGGASMQFVTASFRKSYPIGCVRGRDIAQSKTGMPDCDSDFPAQRKVITGCVNDLTEGALPDKDEMLPCMGVGGTITTLGALAQGLETYNKSRVHGTLLTREKLEELIAVLSRMGKGRKLLPLLTVRHDVILYGAAILAAAMDLNGISELTVSTRDGLEGYLEAAERGELD